LWGEATPDLASERMSAGQLVALLNCIYNDSLICCNNAIFSALMAESVRDTGHFDVKTTEPHVQLGSLARSKIKPQSVSDPQQHAASCEALGIEKQVRKNFELFDCNQCEQDLALLGRPSAHPSKGRSF
jgi:hypothetical protein